MSIGTALHSLGIAVVGACIGRLLLLKDGGRAPWAILCTLLGLMMAFYPVVMRPSREDYATPRQSGTGGERPVIQPIPRESMRSGSQRTVISSVSTIIPAEHQTVIIRGSGFGEHDPYNGCSNFLRVVDVADNWHIGLNPDGGNGCPQGEWPIYVSRWTDNEIVISRFPGYGIIGLLQGLRVFYVGDAVLVTVANAQSRGIVGEDPRGALVRKVSTSISAPH